MSPLIPPLVGGAIIISFKVKFTSIPKKWQYSWAVGGGGAHP